MDKKVVIRNRNDCELKYRVRTMVVIERVSVAGPDGKDLPLGHVIVGYYPSIDDFVEDQRVWGDTIVSIEDWTFE